MLVDTDAIDSVVPAGVLEGLGIERLERQQFTLAGLGLMVNPVTRELLPMRLLLAQAG